ncbi:MAG: alpha/beta hydrolase [Phyllobacteriaceae bacterium]|nr:alpha/beta hydrolase [Phyllobacteriaceae bacterium]
MLDPELEPFLVRWDAEWSTLKAGATPADRRAHFEIVARNMALPAPGDVDASAVHVIDSNAGPVRVRVFRHSGGGVQPALVYMHGGAWMQGSPETHADITSRIASWNRQTVVSIDYALAPEQPFPAAVTQCAAVIEWIFARAQKLGIDARRIAIGGDSAGANIAAALTLVFRDAPERLRAQLLVYPACDFDMTRPSYRENANGPLLRIAGMDAINAMYCPHPADFDNPLVQPLLAKSHAGLPPAFVAVAGHDPLRDSGVAYAEALRADGVDVVLDRSEGLIHGYLRAMAYCAASRAALKRMTDWLSARNAETP